MKFDVKRIADPVHGTVCLSQAEADLLETKAFQRLRNVKQLGLAYLVYPGSDYSRFSHSIGACHIASEVLSALSPKLARLWGEDKDKKCQIFRIAALFHDIGHYPFSHTMEHAIDEHYSQKMLVQKAPAVEPADSPDILDGGAKAKQAPVLPGSLNHERVGKVILEHDAEIRRVFDIHKINTQSITEIFRKEEIGEHAILRNLITADFDVDRIDYLQRTALHTSLPYGTVDTRYLFSQLQIDEDNRLALSIKAMRTIEHLLLGRYFDYMQVSYHKTVAGLEWILSDLIKYLLEVDKLKCGTAEVIAMIESGEWSRFDDVRLLTLIRENTDCGNEIIQLKAKAVLERRPPALVGQCEQILSRGEKDQQDVVHKANEKKLREVASELSEQFSIPLARWHVWARKLKFTDKGSSRDAEDPEYQNLCDEVPRIVLPGSDVSTPIIDQEGSLFNVLGNYKFYGLRLYVLLKEDNSELRAQISQAVRAKMAPLPFR